MCVQGLITEERENIDPDALPFARRVNEAGRQGLHEGASLAEVVCEYSDIIVCTNVAPYGYIFPCIIHVY